MQRSRLAGPNTRYMDAHRREMHVKKESIGTFIACCVVRGLACSIREDTVHALPLAGMIDVEGLHCIWGVDSTLYKGKKVGGVLFLARSCLGLARCRRDRLAIRHALHRLK